MSDTSAPAYRRILLKLSGEALRSPGSMDNISPEIVARIAEEIAQAHRAGVQIGLVVGGGNFWRGAKASVRGMDRATADYVGMLATYERPGPSKRAGTRGGPLRGAIRH